MYLEKKIEDCVRDEVASSIVFECDELDYYDVPKEDAVPEGLYAAMIMGFQDYKDGFKKQYIDVCYKIFSNLTFIQWNNKRVDKITYSYIRIRVMKGSDEERRFRVAMSGLCKKKKFVTDELIGVVELINIVYRGKGEAVIDKHSSTELPASWFEDDISDYYHWSSGYNPVDE